MSQVLNALEYADQHSKDALARLFELLKIKSISTDTAYNKDCSDACDWLVTELKSLNIDASRRNTPGHPMVVGHKHIDAKLPHVLFYGHYDVQPVDPLDLWHRDPFDPVVENTPNGEVIRARGSADDKGQLMTFVEACRAWIKTNGDLPINVSFLFEGEEESGSPSLVPFLQENKEELSTDLALVCDTGMWDANTPAICTMLRGMLGEEITITAADKDLHSGMFGGPATNPLRVLSNILAGLHNDEGRVTLENFYDGVDPLPPNIKQQWQSLGFDESQFLGSVDLSVNSGESGYSALEQLWCRPTCEINGVEGGYTGEGFKTVLPSKASAKISFRLVGHQDPFEIRKAFRTYVTDKLPDDCTIDFKDHGASPAINMSIADQAFERARETLSEEWNSEAVFIGCGGSIPVVGHFQDILNTDSLLIGFGLDDDQIHSPNEKYNLNSFEKGIRSWIKILDSLTPS